MEFAEKSSTFFISSTTEKRRLKIFGIKLLSGDQKDLLPLEQERTSSLRWSMKVFLDFWRSVLALEVFKSYSYFFEKTRERNKREKDDLVFSFEERKINTTPLFRMID